MHDADADGNPLGRELRDRSRGPIFSQRKILSAKIRDETSALVRDNGGNDDKIRRERKTGTSGVCRTKARTRIQASEHSPDTLEWQAGVLKPCATDDGRLKPDTTTAKTDADHKSRATVMSSAQRQRLYFFSGYSETIV